MVRGWHGRVTTTLATTHRPSEASLSLSTNTKRPASGSRSGAVQSWEGHWPPLAYLVKVVAIVVATFWIMMGIKAVAEILLLVAVSLVLAVGMDH
jgi:hypothetical protein